MKPLRTGGQWLLPLASIVNAVSAAIPEFAVPGPSGPYGVKHKTFELVDEARLDPLNSTHPRRLMVSRFDPVKKDECQKMCTVPYMPPATALLEDEINVERGWVGGVFGAAQLQFCCNDDEEEDNDKNYGYGHDQGMEFPLLIFSPGGNTSRLQYSGLVREVSSAGYTVLSVDHPYETDVVEFPDGTIITGGLLNLTGLDMEDCALGVEIRSADVSFILDYMKIPKVRPGDSHDGPSRRVGIFGHSFGGATAATSLSKDLRLAGGINLDGMQFGPVNEEGFGSSKVPQAFVLWGAVGHNTTNIEYDPTWEQFWKSMHTPPHDEVWTRELSTNPSVHNSFTDYALLADAAGVRDQLGDWAKERMAGPLVGTRSMEIFHGYIRDFFAFVLKGEDEGLLKGPSEEFPEMEFIPYKG
ncbi:hypothetical protein FQN53_006831 [Emmonsiellopsis sp. PD_33]|nr:hypothetical protein FQN53_006831 [Emmonsiellopsis sp. PD_33]